jgi:hypothetical protein
MAHTYHGITGWTRVGSAVFFESKSGLKTAQLNYECAAVTTTPPFVEGQQLSSPFSEYRVYPNPSINIGQDGISRCRVDAYSLNSAEKQDELRMTYVTFNGTYFDTSFNPNIVYPMTVRAICKGAYVKDAQLTSNISAPTTGITAGVQILSVYVNNDIPMTSKNSINMISTYTIQSLNQDNKGYVSEVEAIYGTEILSAISYGTNPYG